MAMTAAWLRRLAADAPAPVFCVVGRGARRTVRQVALADTVVAVDSPRHATVLWITGQLPAAWDAQVARVHDQLPHPRTVVGDTVTTDDVPSAAADTAELVTDMPAALAAAHRGVVLGERPSRPPLGPASAPAEWRGVGPHGQGGEGMMGGQPYGRPMAMTGPDPRDGLELDRVAVTLGPFLGWWWPPGLILDVALQGDVVVEAEVADARPFAQPLKGPPLPAAPPPTPVEIVADTLIVAGHRGLAHRWLAAGGHSARACLAGRVRRTFAGFGSGVGRCAVDGTDLRARIAAWVHGATAPSSDVPATTVPLSGAAAIGHLPQILTGLTWREAAVTIASLGLDLEAPGPVDRPRPTDVLSATALEIPA